MWEISPKCFSLVAIVSFIRISPALGWIYFSDPADGVEFTGLNIYINETMAKAGFQMVTITSTECPAGDCIYFPQENAVKVKVNGGKLELEQTLDFEDLSLCADQSKDCVQQLTFWNGGGRGAFNIYIVDDNDNSPVFSNPEDCQTKQVEEERVTEDAICTLKATDGDYADLAKLSASLTSELFEIVRGSDPLVPEFVLKLKAGQKCDYEKSSLHSLSIVLEDDGGKHTTTLRTSIEVTDIADTPPQWSVLQPSVTVQETTLVGTEFLTITAIDGDRDINSPFEYSINSGNDDGYFEIQTILGNGVILLRKKLDATELMATRSSLMFGLEVIAKEVQAPQAELKTTISIIIEDENTKPVLVSNGVDVPSNTMNLEFTCAETNAQCLGTFVAIDTDVAQQNNKYYAEWKTNTNIPDFVKDAFTLVSCKSDNLEGNGETTYTLQVRDVTKIDFDTIPQWRDPAGVTFEIKVREDGDVSEATIHVTVKVTNENDNQPKYPVDQVFEVSVEENQKIKYVLPFELKAEDADFGNDFGTASLIYKWEQNSRQPTYLTFADPTKGVISVSAEPAFDYEMYDTDHSETFYVQVTDNHDAGNFLTVPIKINIANINDEQPSIQARPSRLTILENAVEFVQIPNELVPFDPDVDQNLVCTLEVLGVDDESDVHNWFELAPDCKKINVVGVVDREWELKNGAENGSFIDRVTLRVKIEDLNTVPGYPSEDSATLTVDITDENDEPPMFAFESSDLWILETDFDGEDPDSPAKRKIVDLIATDYDKNTNYCFDIVGANSRLVELDAEYKCNSRGKVTLRRVQGQKIDREMIPPEDNNYIKFHVNVSDGIHETTKEIKVRVEDIDDNAPVFINPPTEWHVMENLNKNPFNPGDKLCQEDVQILFTVEAIDADECSEFSHSGCVSYAFENGDTLYKGFLINSTSGQVTTKGCEIDREETETIDLVIWAYSDNFGGCRKQSGLSTYITVRIIVEDVNDNSPHFLTSNETAMIEFPEETPEGMEVGTIEIQDADAGSNAQMNVTIEEIICERPGGKCGEVPPFRIKSQNQVGNKIKATLETSDFNFTYAYGLYTLRVKAEDQGEKHKSNDQTYQIRVVDINNNFPEMDTTFNGATFHIPAGQSGEIRIQDGNRLPFFNATDLDEPDNLNSELTFFIVEEASEGPWREYIDIRLNKGEGELWLIKPWDWNENTGPFHFKICVKVKDAGSEPKTSKHQVCYNLDIIAKDLRPPYFEIQENCASIRENGPPEIDFGAFVNAVNPDTAKSVHYVISGFGSDVQKFFQLKNSTSNIISTKQSLDHEYKESHEILIYATHDLETIPPYVDCPLDFNLTKSYTRINVTVVDIQDVRVEYQ